MVERARLRDYVCCGENLPARIEAEILDHKDTIVSALVEILQDGSLAAVDARGDGYAPVHAAHLLGKLGAPEAVEPMIERLRETGFDDILHNALLFALPRIGAAVVEPALRAYAGSDDPDLQVSLAGALAECGVRDDRIYELLLKMLPNETEQAAGCLWRYGDHRALEHLVRAFDSFRIERGNRALANQTLIELREAIEQLGGALTPEQEAKYTVAMEPRDRWRAQMDTYLQAQSARPRPGRNEPCWCGSTKKYKRCHLDEDGTRLGRHV